MEIFMLKQQFVYYLRSPLSKFSYSKFSTRTQTEWKQVLNHFNLHVTSIWIKLWQSTHTIYKNSSAFLQKSQFDISLLFIHLWGHSKHFWLFSGPYVTLSIKKWLFFKIFTIWNVKWIRNILILKPNLALSNVTFYSKNFKIRDLKSKEVHVTCHTSLECSKYFEQPPVPFLFHPLPLSQSHARTHAHTHARAHTHTHTHIHTILKLTKVIKSGHFLFCLNLLQKLSSFV